MAKRKRKTSGRSTASRRKNRTQDRMPAGLITLFAGLVLMALAFVPGSSAWRTMHDVLFGVFGCGSFVLGAALCYLAILYTRGEDLLPHIAKLVLGLIFASGTVIVFSDIPTDQTAAQMTAACYHEGYRLFALLGNSHTSNRCINIACIQGRNQGIKAHASDFYLVTHLLTNCLNQLDIKAGQLLGAFLREFEGSKGRLSAYTQNLGRFSLFRFLFVTATAS